MNGIELLRAALRLDGLLAVVVMTGFGSIDNAVEAMRSGAADFIEKPFRVAAIKSVLTRALSVRHLRPSSLPVILLAGWGQRLIDEEGPPPNVDYVPGKPPKVRDLREALRSTTTPGPAFSRVQHDTSY